MKLLEAMEKRHAVRSYEDKPIEGEVLSTLQDAIAECNKEGDLHIQLVQNEPQAFDSRMAHYGNFSGVSNYLALIGKKSPTLEERCGYYGEKLVLLATTLGLSSCWVAMTYKKIPDAFTLNAGEKLVIVIALGYGKTTGNPHKAKDISAVSNANSSSPEWFESGVKAALLAPTAVNQQKYHFELKGDKVAAKAGFGPCTKIDLGIVKYHFEVGSGKGSEIWA